MKAEFLNEEYRGGSYAKSGTVTRFRKEASVRGVQKLKDEASFIANLPGGVKEYYPRLLSSGSKGDWAYLEQEYVPLKNFRQRIFDRSISLEKAGSFLDKILQISKEDFFNRHKKPAPSDYVDQAYFFRFWNRLVQTIERAPVFDPLIKAPKICINDKEYWNAPSIVSFFNSLAAEKKTDVFEFRDVSPYMHGDLHFQNILIGQEDNEIKFVDPRGYPVCDLFYDMGKLSHSLNGKYDFIHEGLFSMNAENRSGTLSYGFNIKSGDNLEMYNNLLPVLEKFCRQNGDPDCLKMLFAEAIHFCSDMPFHLQGDGTEKKSVALYITGVKILNKIAEELEIGFDGDRWGKVGISTLRASKQEGWSYNGG